MSTRLEDLPDSDYEESVEELKEEQQQQQEQVSQMEIFQKVYEGAKRPALVTILMFFLGHPLLSSGISIIPNIEYLTDRISIHLLMSILAGIFFFFIGL